MKLLRSYYDIFEVTKVIFQVTMKLLETVANKGLQRNFNFRGSNLKITSKLLQSPKLLVYKSYRLFLAIYAYIYRYRAIKKRGDLK